MSNTNSHPSTPSFKSNHVHFKKFNKTFVVLARPAIEVVHEK